MLKMISPESRKFCIIYQRKILLTNEFNRYKFGLSIYFYKTINLILLSLYSYAILNVEFWFYIFVKHEKNIFNHNRN